MTGEEVMRETWPDRIIERCGAAATKWMLDDTGESAPRWFRKAKALSSILMIDADQHSLEKMRRNFHTRFMITMNPDHMLSM